MSEQGDTWRPQKDNRSIVGGHAVCAFGYGKSGCAVCSWGRIFYMTWPFWEEYVDEAHIAVSANWIKGSGLAPSGVDLQALLQDAKEY